MTAFTTAWSLLKGDPIFSVKDIRDLRERIKREKDTGVYDVNRGDTNLERLMGIYPLGQSRFTRAGIFDPDVPHNAENTDKRFRQGYRQRMDTSPRPTPTKVVRIPDFYQDEYGHGMAYELQDEKGNRLSRLDATKVTPEQNKYNEYIKNALPMLIGLHGKTPKEHQ